MWCMIARAMILPKIPVVFAAALLVCVGVFGLRGASVAQAESLDSELDRAQGTTDARTNNSLEADALIEESQIGTGTPGFFGLDPRTATAAEYVNTIFRWAGGFIIFMAVAMVTWGGFGYVFSAGKESTIKRSKEMIFGALLAVVLLILTYAVLLLIDPRLVQLRQDFGAGDIDTAEFSPLGAVMSCNTDADCQTDDPLLNAPFENCGTFLDDGGVQSVTPKCDQTTKTCVLPEGQWSAVLESLGGCSDVDWFPGSKYQCEPGTVSVPINVEGNISQIDDDMTEDMLNVSFWESLSLSTYFGTSYNEDLYNSMLAVARYAPGGLLENITTPQQVDMLESQAGVDVDFGNYYHHHECRPVTVSQQIAQARDSGQPVGSISCSASDGSVVGYRAIYRRACDPEGTLPYFVGANKYECVNGRVYMAENGFCGYEAAEGCFNTTIPAGKRWTNDPCEPGTACLLEPNEGDYLPANYRCLSPDDGGLTGLYRGNGSPFGSRLGGACRGDADCGSAEQTYAACSGNNIISDSVTVDMVCQQGQCRIAEGEFCGQDAGACGSRTVPARNFDSYCAQGTTCKPASGVLQSVLGRVEPTIYECQ